LVPSLIYALEGWSNITEEEIDKFEKIQYRQLKSIMHMRESTPNIGILMETGIWPIREKIYYHKMMLYHTLIHSDDKRVAKMLVEEQKNNDIPRTFYSKVKEISKLININLNNADKMGKEKWRKQCKDKLRENIQTRMNKYISESTKLRFLLNDKFEMKQYIKEVAGNTAIKIMRVRLNMVDVRMNYKGSHGGDLSCPLCRVENDTTEHLLLCKTNRKYTKGDVRDSGDIAGWNEILEVIHTNINRRI
jgi:hypothetical protein